MRARNPLSNSSTSAHDGEPASSMRSAANMRTLSATAEQSGVPYGVGRTASEERLRALENQPSMRDRTPRRRSEPVGGSTDSNTPSAHDRSASLEQGSAAVKASLFTLNNGRAALGYDEDASVSPFGENDHAPRYPVRVGQSVQLPDSVTDPSKRGEADELKNVKTTHSRMRVDLMDDSEAPGCWDSFTLSLRNVWCSLKQFRFFLHLTLVDLRARKGTYGLSFCSVLFVVLLCVVMISVLNMLPVVFVRLAEPSVGQADLVLTPGGQMGEASSLNYSAIRRILDTMPATARLHTPRVHFDAYGFTPRQCRARRAADLWFPFPDDANSSETTGSELAGSGTDTLRQVCTRTCYAAWCQRDTGPVVTVYALNSTQEDAIGFGSLTNFPYVAPPKGYAVVSNAAAAAMRVKVGEEIFLVAKELDGVLNQFFAPIPESRRSYNIIMKLVVSATSPAYSYKFPDTDNYVLVNYEQLAEMLAEGMSPTITRDEREAVASTPTDSAVTAVYLRIPEPERFAAYVHSDYLTIAARVMSWGAPIITALGSNQVLPRTPILRFLRTMEFFSIFVGLIMSIILLAMALLSVVLIYSLLTVSIETRQYELGIQRMIGFTREGLVVMVLFNAYCFAIPAWIVGLGGGQGLYALLRYLFNRFASIQLPSLVSGASVGFATLIGLLIPLLASIFPILSLITLKLPEALDATHGRAGVIYKIKHNGTTRFDGTMFSIGFFFALLGFLLYYLFPASLVARNLQLMFYIFFAILLGMLGGLTLLASNFERVVETALFYAVGFWERRAVFRVVLKSLASHRMRNRKTSLMYSLSLSFIIFIAVAFSVQIVSIEYQDLRNKGGEIVVTFAPNQRVLAPSPTSGELDTVTEEVDPSFIDAGLHADSDSSDSSSSQNSTGYRGYVRPTPFYGFSSEKNFYIDDYIEFREYLGPLMKSGVVASMTYRGSPLPPVAWNLQYLYTQTPGRYAISGWSMIPIAPNLFQTLFSRFIIVNRYRESVGRYGISEALYTAEGITQFVLATTTFRRFGLTSMDAPAVCRSGLLVNETSSTPQIRDRPLAFSTSTVMDSSPLFLMSKFENSLGDILTSFPTLARFSGIDYLSTRSMPLLTIVLRVPRKDDYDAVKEAISDFMSKNTFFPQIQDAETSVRDIRTANSILTIFFLITILMILVICFFALMSNMTSNVLDSSKEIAILLCMGMTHFQLYRVYVWEAFILVLASGLLGLLCGTAVAYTMQMQNVLFTQISLPFSFPFIHLGIVAGAGLISAIAASVGPVTYLLSLPSITHILRRAVG